jgi:hypothetical protein
MALKKIIELEGDTFLNTPYGSIKTGQSKIAIATYIKVQNVSGNKNSINANVVFTDDSIQFNKSYSFSASTDDGAPNYIKQAYEHLKTLPEFENSEDC